MGTIKNQDLFKIGTIRNKAHVSVCVMIWFFDERSVRSGKFNLTRVFIQ